MKCYMIAARWGHGEWSPVQHVEATHLDVALKRYFGGRHAAGFKYATVSKVNRTDVKLCERLTIIVERER